MIYKTKIPPAFRLDKLQAMNDISPILGHTKEFWYEYQRISGRFDTKQF